MAIVRPFRALRPPVERAAQVASVPYDVVNTEEARALAADNAYSFLHVSRPEIDLPPETDIYSAQVYAQARANFDKLRAECPLLVEDEPSFYLYRLKMGQHQQTGLVACCSVDEYDQDIIRKHERTRRDKEDDRTRHIVTLRAQTGPVFLTYRGRAEINRLVEDLVASAPLYDFTAPDGIAHSIWRVPADQTDKLVEAFGAVPLLYIADGHHRAASASRARATLAAEASSATGQQEYDFFQCVLFPADQLQILPYNRIVKDLGDHTPASLRQAVAAKFEVTETSESAPPRGEFGMYLAGQWYRLKPREAVTGTSPIDTLDVSVLQERLFAPVLGIMDQRTDKRIDFVGGIRGTAELERLVDSGQAAVAFSLAATTVDELMAIADAGEIMPPKSTWFEPKLRDGLLSHLI